MNISTNTSSQQPSKESIMPKQFILLNALIPQDFGYSLAEMVEAAEEWGCKFMVSEGLRDPGSKPLTQKYYYLTSNSLEALRQCVEAIDLTGVVVEVTGVWDNVVVKEEIVVH